MKQDLLQNVLLEEESSCDNDNLVYIFLYLISIIELARGELNEQGIVS